MPLLPFPGLFPVSCSVRYKGGEFLPYPEKFHLDASFGVSRYCRQFVYGDFLQVKEFHQGFFIGRKPLQGLFEVLHLRLPEQNFLLVVGKFVLPVIYLYRAGGACGGYANRRVVGYPVEPGGETALPAEPVQMGERFQEYVGCQFFRIQPVARNACQQGEDTSPYRSTSSRKASGSPSDARCTVLNSLSSSIFQF